MQMEKNEIVLDLEQYCFGKRLIKVYSEKGAKYECVLECGHKLYVNKRILKEEEELKEKVIEHINTCRKLGMIISHSNKREKIGYKKGVLKEWYDNMD